MNKIERFSLRKENNVEKDKIIELANSLELSEDENYIKKSIPIFFDLLEREVGIKLGNDVMSIYKKMNDEHHLGRIESISRVLMAFEKNESFQIGKGESHYANAVIPDPEGIKLAFSEGRASSPVSVLIGFGKTIIGFKIDNLQVYEVDFSPEERRDAAKRKYLCRHVEGHLTKKDIKEVIMRIPRKFLDEKSLKEDELKEAGPFIFRTFTIDE